MESVEHYSTAIENANLCSKSHYIIYPPILKFAFFFKFSFPGGTPQEKRENIEELGNEQNWDACCEIPKESIKQLHISYIICRMYTTVQSSKE